MRYDRQKLALLYPAGVLGFEQVEAAGFLAWKPRGAYYILTDAAHFMKRYDCPDDTAFALVLRVFGQGLLPQALGTEDGVSPSRPQRTGGRGQKGVGSARASRAPRCRKCVRMRAGMRAGRWPHRSRPVR